MKIYIKPNYLSFNVYLLIFQKNLVYKKLFEEKKLNYFILIILKKMQEICLFIHFVYLFMHNALSLITGHDYGLWTIERIVNAYDGMMEINYDDHRFTITVALKG